MTNRDGALIMNEDVSLMPSVFGVSAVHVALFGGILLILLWPGFFLIPSLLPFLVVFDILLVLLVAVGVVATSHYEHLTFREYCASVIKERAGQPRLVSDSTAVPPLTVESLEQRVEQARADHKQQGADGETDSSSTPQHSQLTVTRGAESRMSQNRRTIKRDTGVSRRAVERDVAEVRKSSTGVEDSRTENEDTTAADTDTASKAAPETVQNQDSSRDQ